MSGPFREMPDVLGAAEREGAAIREFARWRDRLQSRVLLGFALVGLVVAIPGFLVVRDLQFQWMNGVALMWVTVAAGCVAPFVLAMFFGGRVASALARRRAPAVVARLAARYEIADTELTKIVSMSQL